jgi:hypothetical protein
MTFVKAGIYLGCEYAETFTGPREGDTAFE